MTDDYTTLNPGVGGDPMDETGVTFGISPTTRKRPRVVLGGANPADLIQPLATDTVGTEMGLIVREAPRALLHPGTAVALYGNAASVAANSATSVSTYNVPSGKNFYVVGFTATGTMDAKFTLYINGVVTMIGRTTIAAPVLQMSFDIVRPSASQTQTVVVQVLHTNTGLLGSFDATLLGFVV